MKKYILFILLGLIFLETACRYTPQSQTWQPRTHGPINTKKPKAYRR